MAKIAIIDDDQDIIYAVTITLTAKGYQVVSAKNVNDGMKLVENEKPDLILLDVMMEEPDDGFYLATKLRKAGVQTPIFLLTSVSKATGLEFAGSQTLQVNEFLEKPLSSEILLQKINQYLGNV
jgi:DNA-binding response OmpR family regulator